MSGSLAAAVLVLVTAIPQGFERVPGNVVDGCCAAPGKNSSDGSVVFAGNASSETECLE